MKFIYIFALMVMIFFCGHDAYGRNSEEKLRDEVAQLRREVELFVRHERAEVEDLKNVLGTNLQITNGGITFGLAIISTLGVYGLTKLNRAKEQLEKTLDDYKADHSKVENCLMRIQSLEMLREINRLKQQKNYVKAHDKVCKALKIDKKNPELVIEQAILKGRLCQYDEAIKILRRALLNDECNTYIILTLLELYLFKKDIIRFDNEFIKYRAIIYENYRNCFSVLTIYFNVIKAYLTGSLPEMEDAITTFRSSQLTKMPPNVWDFEDFDNFIINEEKTEAVSTLREFVTFIRSE